MKIDFYVYDLHELQVWEGLRASLEKLGADTRLVLEPPGISTAMVTADDYDDIREWLASRRLSCLARGRYDQADAVITTQGVGWLWRYRGLKLRVADGCGLSHDARGHSKMNTGLDGVFVYGDWSRQQVARWLPDSDVIASGCPKLAPLVRGQLNRAALARGFGLRPGVKTIVYLTTWGQASSLQRFADTVAALGQRYNVVHKPHHRSLRLERPSFDALRRSSNVLVDERERDLAPFLCVADIILADARSGALAEAMIAGCPVIALSAANDAAVDRLIDGVAAATPVCGDPRELDRLVDELLLEDSYRAGRLALVSRLFARGPGKADANTAEAILAHIARKNAGAGTVAEPELAFAGAI